VHKIGRSGMGLGENRGQEGGLVLLGTLQAHPWAALLKTSMFSKTPARPAHLPDHSPCHSPHYRVEEQEQKKKQRTMLLIDLLILLFPLSVRNMALVVMGGGGAVSSGVFENMDVFNKAAHGWA